MDRDMLLGSRVGFSGSADLMHLANLKMQDGG